MNSDHEEIAEVVSLLKLGKLKEAYKRAINIKDELSKARALYLVADKAREKADAAPIFSWITDYLHDTPGKIFIKAIGELARMGYVREAEELSRKIEDVNYKAQAQLEIAKAKLENAKAEYERAKRGMPVERIERPSLLAKDLGIFEDKPGISCPKVRYQRVDDPKLLALVGNFRRIRIQASELYLVKCGSYSCVYVTDKFAIKIPKPVVHGIYRNASIPSDVLENFIREAENALKLEHPNVIKLYDYSRDPPLLLYERADCDLWNICEHYGRLELKTTLKILLEVSKGLTYLHSKGFVHGDLKPHNILLARGTVKIGDLGALSNLLLQSSTGIAVQVTPRYCAPEQVDIELKKHLVRRGLAGVIDIYQLANVALELLGIEPLPGISWSQDDVKRRLDLVFEKTRNMGLAQLISEMLNKEPTSRPSAIQVAERIQEILEDLVS